MLLRSCAFLVLLCIFLHSDALPQYQAPRAKGTIEAAPIATGEDEVGEKEGRDGEPSCQELKAMWRFSKRQSRAPEITNEIPTYRDPFAINVWDDYARPRSAGRVGFPYPRRQMVYGKLVHILPKVSEHSPERIKAFQDVFANRDFNPASIQQHRKNNFHRHGGGGGVRPLQPQSQGSFQHLKELIRNERARELQEQRMSDEAERSSGKDSGKYPYGRLNESPLSADNVIIRSKPAGGSRRMAGYPSEMLMSARYLDEYPYPNQHVAMNKYKPQYADTSLNRWSQLAFPPLNRGLAYGRQGSPRKPRPRHQLTWQ